MNLLFAKIKKIKYDSPNNKVSLSGIRVIKHLNFEDILHPDQKTIDDLFDLMLDYGLQSQFANHYENIKVLGQGNYAKVYLVKRLSDGKELAAKIFDIES